MKNILAVLTLALTIGFGVSACTATQSTHCPGTGSTGTLKTHKGQNCKAGHCSGTASTGTIKPKVSKKTAKEDGLFSPKMNKTMAKSK